VLGGFGFVESGGGGAPGDVLGGGIVWSGVVGIVLVSGVVAGGVVGSVGVAD
jgi:hypothetical protein